MAAHLNQKLVTAHLNKLARQHTEIDGVILTRAEAAAVMLFKHAVGFHEAAPNDTNDEPRMLYYPPKQWAMSMLLDRLEGKVANADESAKQNVGKRSDEVAEMAQERARETGDAILAKITGAEQRHAGRPAGDAEPQP
ncbi:MAG: hypothetical protein AAGG38_02130 [Planctomycetota bacterium]